MAHTLMSLLVASDKNLSDVTTPAFFWTNFNFSKQKIEKPRQSEPLFRFLSDFNVILSPPMDQEEADMKGTHNFTAIMVHAYSHVSGRDLGDAITDLGFSGLISLESLQRLSTAEHEILQDVLLDKPRILSWRR